MISRLWRVTGIEAGYDLPCGYRVSNAPAAAYPCSQVGRTVATRVMIARFRSTRQSRKSLVRLGPDRVWSYNHVCTSLD